MADAVVDTTVLIAFGHLARLDLLPELYESVWAPDAVYREAVRHPQYPEVPRIQRAFDAGHVRLLVREPAGAATGFAGLGAGEAEAITAARELGAVVVLDDANARHVARSLGLRLVGSVGLLIEARNLGLIPAVLPLIDELQAAGFRIGPPELDAARAADSR